MKLHELFVEMTARMPHMDFEKMAFPEFPEDAKFVGKMEGGLSVYYFKYLDTDIYGVKIDNEYAIFTQIQKINVPKLGDIFEVLNSKVKEHYRGSALSYKLLMFLTFELNKSLLFGNVHSAGTSAGLKKVQNMFDLNLFNIKTGEQIEFDFDKYLKLTKLGKETEWRVLFLGNPFSETKNHCFGYLGKEHENRSLWTYGEVNWPNEDLIL